MRGSGFPRDKSATGYVGWRCYAAGCILVLSAYMHRCRNAEVLPEFNLDFSAVIRESGRDSVGRSGKLAARRCKPCLRRIMVRIFPHGGGWDGLVLSFSPARRRPSTEEDARMQNGGQQPGAHILGAGDEAQIEMRPAMKMSYTRKHRI